MNFCYVVVELGPGLRRCAPQNVVYSLTNMIGDHISWKMNQASLFTFTFFFSSDTNERNLSIEMGNEIQTCKITELKMIHTFSGGNTHATFEREMDGKQSSWFCSRKILSFIFVSSGFYFLVEYRNDVRKNGKCSGLVHSFSVHSSILLLCVFDWMPPKKRKECCENVLSIIRFVLLRTHSHASIREWMRRIYRRDGVWHAFKSNAVAGEKKMGRDS